MSRWSDRFNSHVSKQLLDQLLVSNQEFVDVEAEDSAGALEKARFAKVIGLVASIYKMLDPDLLSLQFLSDLQNPLQHTINSLNASVSAPTLGNLQGANDNIDTVLFLISSAPTLARNGKSLPISKTLDDYNREIKKYIDSVEKRAAESQSEISATADLVFKYLSEESEKMAGDILENETELQNVKSQTATQVTEFGTQFSTFIEGLRISAESTTKENKTRMDSKFVALANKSGAIVVILEKLKNDAETVFGVVQNTIQAGAHKEYADREENIANLIRNLAFALMLMAITIVLGPEVFRIFDVAEGYSFNVDSAIKRGLLSLIIFAPAFYLARESSNHRKIGVRNRRTELTLRTLDPYLALIAKETDRDEIKKKIAESIFSESSVQGATEDTGQVLSQVNKLINSLAKVRSD